MGARPYRAPAKRPKPYDPGSRVLACDACGEPLFAGAQAETLTCGACSAKLEVTEAPELTIFHSPNDDEAARIAHLAAHADPEWSTPDATARFVRVLDAEIPEARALWAELRRRLAENPEAPDTARELVMLTGSLHRALPCVTDDQKRARRALLEASCEVVTAPGRRQGLMHNLVVGAAHAGDLQSARGWLAKLDPYSRDLRADSHYRIAAAVIATAERDWPAVLKQLDKRADIDPWHPWVEGMAAVLRANALERLGNLDAAVQALSARIAKDHDGLGLVTRLVNESPSSWNTCERSMPGAAAWQYSKLASRIPDPSGAFFLVAMIVTIGLFVGAGLSSNFSNLQMGLVAGGVLGVLVVILERRASGRHRQRVASECVVVNGRVHAARPHHALQNARVLDVTIERNDGPDLRVTAVVTMAPATLELDLKGVAFRAFWHPEYPTKFPKITFFVSGEAADAAEAKVREAG